MKIVSLELAREVARLALARRRSGQDAGGRRPAGFARKSVTTGALVVEVADHRVEVGEERIEPVHHRAQLVEEAAQRGQPRRRGLDQRAQVPEQVAGVRRQAAQVAQRRAEVAGDRAQVAEERPRVLGEVLQPVERQAGLDLEGGEDPERLGERLVARGESAEGPVRADDRAGERLVACA